MILSKSKSIALYSNPCFLLISITDTAKKKHFHSKWLLATQKWRCFLHHFFHEQQQQQKVKKKCALSLSLLYYTQSFWYTILKEKKHTHTRPIKKIYRGRKKKRNQNINYKIKYLIDVYIVIMCKVSSPIYMWNDISTCYKDKRYTHQIMKKKKMEI